MTTDTQDIYIDHPPQLLLTEEEQVIVRQPKRAPIQRKTTSFPLLDGTSEGRIHFVLFALRRAGFASWTEETSDSAELVTEASLEQLCACAGPALGFLK